MAWSLKEEINTESTESSIFPDHLGTKSTNNTCHRNLTSTVSVNLNSRKSFWQLTGFIDTSFSKASFAKEVPRKFKTRFEKESLDTGSMTTPHFYLLDLRLHHPNLRWRNFFTKPYLLLNVDEKVQHFSHYLIFLSIYPISSLRFLVEKDLINFGLDLLKKCYKITLCKEVSRILHRILLIILKWLFLKKIDHPPSSW